MNKALLLLLLFVPPTSRWVKEKDSYRVHWRHVNVYGNTLGEYYQPYPNSGLAVPVDPKFTAICYDGHPVEFAGEQEARDYVLRCPSW